MKEEIGKVIDLVLYIFKTLNFHDFLAQVSLRDPINREKYIGSDENWEKAELAIQEVANEKGLRTVVEYGEAAFYGPKLDFMVRDAIGRKWQLGTVQIDYNLPERFELSYNGADNKPHRPVMIHRAPFGSMERFVGILIEHFAGDFPTWLAPEQVRVISLNDDLNAYCEEIGEKLKQACIRATVDTTSDKLGAKIRRAEITKVPHMLVIGQKEAEANSVSVRSRARGDEGVLTADACLARLKAEVSSRALPDRRKAATTA